MPDIFNKDTRYYGKESIEGFLNKLINKTVIIEEKYIHGGIEDYIKIPISVVYYTKLILASYTYTKSSEKEVNIGFFGGLKESTVTINK